MKKKNKIILVGTGVVLLGGIIFGVHEVLLQNAKHDLNQAQVKLKTEQDKLSKFQKELTDYEHSSPSNLKGNFPSTTFQKKEDVVLPIQTNYKVNNANVAKWVATYMTELRQLNHVNSKVTWQENSPEQAFVHALVTTGNVQFTGKYEVAGYSEVNPNATPHAGSTESDQETA